MRLADVRDARKHPLLDANLDERGKQRRGQLNLGSQGQCVYIWNHVGVCRTYERRARRNLDIVSQFEILNERQRLRERLNGVAFKYLAKILAVDQRNEGPI